MKIAFFGMGSIGRRHENNLKIIRPKAMVAVYDPPRDIGTFYETVREFMGEHRNADGVIIASPTECHSDQMELALSLNLSVYIEKPLMTIERWSQWHPSVIDMLIEHSMLRKVAVGYQYRFAVRPDTIAKWRKQGRMTFYASDNLIERYGPTVIETMGSHGIDLALYTLGAAKSVALFTDGRYFKGRIEHEHGVSDYDMRIDMWPRKSYVNMDELSGDNQAYVDALGAWLTWIETGQRDPRLATLADGARVMDVMAQCKILQGA